MKSITRIGKGVIGAVVSLALFIGCLPISAVPVLAAEGDTPATITLGGSSTSSDYHMPIRTNRAHSVSEQIYTASELGNAGGTISSIAFYSTGSASRNIRVYLADTSKTSFTSNTNWIKEGTLCYEGSVRFSSNAWTTIDFSTTFAHTATSNLAVIVIDYSGSTATQRNFRYYAGSSNQCIYASGSSAYTLNTLSTNGTRTANKPAIQISILKNMTVTAPDVTVDWDGEAHGLTVTATDAGSGATISGATVMYGTSAGTYDQSSLEYTDAGTYDIYYQVKASGYATVTGSATVVINSIGTVVCNADNVEVNYDGQPHGIDVQVTTPTSGYTIEYRTDPEAQWTTTNPTVTDVTDEAVTVYYKVSAPGYTAATGYATVVINEASSETTVTWDFAVVSGINVSDWGSPSFTRNDITLSYSGSGSRNYFYSNNITIGTTSGEGLIFSSSAGNITSIVIACSSSSATNLPSGWSKSGNNFVWTGSSDSVSLLSSGRRILANSISSITFTIESSATKTMTVSAEDVNVQYDGDPHSITVVATDAVSGETITGTTVLYRTDPNADWSSDVPAVTDVGSQTVYYQVSADGYTPAEGSATIKVTEGTIQYSASGYSDAFDGQPHSIEVEVTTPAEGAVIEYRADSETQWSTVNPTFTSGTHTVYFQISAENYATTDVDSAQVIIADIDMTVSAEDVNVTYDGQPHGITVTATDAVSGEEITGATVMFGTTEGTYDQTTSPTLTNVDSIKVFYEVTAEGYNTVRGYAVITISNATISYTAENYTTTYDGGFYGINVQVTAPTSGYSIQYRADSETEWSTVNPTFTTGTHTVYFQISAPNYTTTEVDSRTVTINNATMQYSASGTTTTYDGNSYGISVSVTKPASGATILYSETEGVFDPTATTSPTYSAAGTHTVYYQISATGYDTITGSANVVINPATISYTASDYSAAYDGAAHGITVTVNTPSGATVRYGTQAGVYNLDTSPTLTNVGSQTVYFQITADNYTPVTGHKTITVTPGTIVCNAADYSAAYDGQPHGISLNVTTPASGYRIEYSTNNRTWSTNAITRTNVTTGAVTVYWRISADNYTQITGSNTITISNATISYTAENYSGTYDGQPHSIAVNVTSPANARIQYSTTSINGPWSNTVHTETNVTSDPVTVYFRISATNYNTVTGSRTITISPATIVYSAQGYDDVYDGAAHTISVTATTPANAQIRYRDAQGQYTLTTPPTFTDVVETAVYYQISYANYTTVTDSATVIITPATLSYSVQGDTCTYDGNEHNITVTVNTPASGATVLYRTRTSDEWSDELPTFTAAGTYLVYYQISAANYTTVDGSATVSISEADMTVTANDVTAVYDGEEYSIAVVVTDPASDYTIKYGTVEGVYNLDTAPAFTNVGTNTVYYQVTAANYNTFTGSATVTISNATMTVEATGYSAPYDGEAHGIEVNVITPASGATVLYGESEEACTETTSPTYSYGEHTVYFVVSADNYNDYTGSATVVISDIDVVADVEAYNGPYDGEEHGITITVTDPAEGATVMYGTEEGSYDYEVSPVFTEIGDYTVFYMITAEGHNPLEGSATVSIGELTIDATVTPYDGVFDGAEHGVTVTVNTPEVGATVLFGTEEGVYDLDESPTYCEIGTYTVYYQISAEYYAPLEGSVVVRISDNPDRDNARDNLIAILSASDEILGEWAELLPDELVEALMDAEQAAYEVLDNEIATTEQLEAAADNLANVLGSVLQYIAENFDIEPELTPEQRTRLCVINFVENLYLHALGRPFDVSGRDSWVSLIMDQGGTGTQVARGFLGSQEFLGLGLDNEGFVKALYNALFNRAPEAEEVDTWTNALAAGVTREEVINAFFASPEWARTCAYYRVNI